MNTAIFESGHDFFRHAVGLMPQNSIEIVLVYPGENPFTFVSIVKRRCDGKTTSAKFAPSANKKRAAILKRDEGGRERWHSNKAEHAQMPPTAEALQECPRSANTDQDSLLFELVINSRYSGNGDSKVVSYLSYRIKDLRFFLLVCDRNATQNFKQPRSLVLLCLENLPRWKTWKTSRHFLPSHDGHSALGETEAGDSGAANHVTVGFCSSLSRVSSRYSSPEFARRSSRKV